ncbi:helix-turn-helix transcriptional regulator [Nonomuraea sp. LPB2021202275-12-8]|uniref:helix-turn-helix transcriptional regulator n=1 Tax=Nonomuraea sp. LPB2021202275-12-8 TaxID=3120159 RepID=UPI00300D77F3
MGLTSQDYERMLDLAVALLDSTEPELEWPRLTAELNDALHGALCLFLDNVQLLRGAGDVQAWAPDWPGELPLTTLLRANMGAHPLAVHYTRDEHDRAPHAITDVTTESSWRRTPTYDTMRSLMGVDEQIALPLAAPPGTIRSFLICRPLGERVTERDQAYAARVQPLLVTAEKHLRHLRRWRESGGPAPAERAADLGVTPRETAVVSLLAKGLTAVAIGRRLGISPRTVHKHQENLYRKLGAADRVTAILRAQAAGLLPQHRARDAAAEG